MKLLKMNQVFENLRAKDTFFFTRATIISDQNLVIIGREINVSLPLLLPICEMSDL